MKLHPQVILIQLKGDSSEVLIAAYRLFQSLLLILLLLVVQQKLLQVVIIGDFEIRRKSKGVKYGYEILKGLK